MHAWHDGHDIAVTALDKKRITLSLDSETSRFSIEEPVPHMLHDLPEIRNPAPQFLHSTTPSPLRNPALHFLKL